MDCPLMNVSVKSGWSHTCYFIYPDLLPILGVVVAIGLALFAILYITRLELPEPDEKKEAKA